MLMKDIILYDNPHYNVSGQENGKTGLKIFLL